MNHDTKPKGRVRVRAVHVCFSQEEFRQLYELTGETGLSISAWIRLMVRDQHRALVRRLRDAESDAIADARDAAARKASL